eukprot:15367177-Ditylum_brightwellii.AAC.1
MEKQKFQLWWIYFRAYRSICVFSQSLSSTMNPALPDQEDAEITGDDATVKAQRKAVKSNAIVM